MKNKLIPLTLILLTTATGAMASPKKYIKRKKNETTQYAQRKFDHQVDNVKHYYKEKLAKPIELKLKAAGKDIENFARTKLKEHARIIIAKFEDALKELKNDPELRYKIYSKLEAEAAKNGVSQEQTLLLKIAIENRLGAFDNLSETSYTFLSSLTSLPNSTDPYFNAATLKMALTLIPDEVEHPLVEEALQLMISKIINVEFVGAAAKGSSTLMAVDTVVESIKDGTLNQKQAHLILTSLFNVFTYNFLHPLDVAYILREHMELLELPEADSYFDYALQLYCYLSETDSERVLVLEESEWNSIYVRKLPPIIAAKLTKYIMDVKLSFATTQKSCHLLVIPLSNEYSSSATPSIFAEVLYTLERSRSCPHTCHSNHLIGE
ncbi:MAG: hypothetical protein P0S95_01705 [Rhabdochlamydiaceae bacterium]|nr:hypothetical protein [Candidatus Amphrikana amoebophyrae]